MAAMMLLPAKADQQRRDAAGDAAAAAASVPSARPDVGTDTLAAGIVKAGQVIADGAARAKFDALIAYSKLT